MEIFLSWLLLFLLLLLLLSIIGFVIGLINPRWVVFRGEKTRGRAARTYGILVAIFFALIVLASPLYLFKLYLLKAPSISRPYPASPSPTIPPPSNDPVVLLKETLKSSLRSGQIAFNVPQEMRVEETELVEVRISDNLQRDLKAELSGKPETAKIEVGSFMKARLDGTNFTIKPLSEENQALLEGRVAEWRWSVTPTEQGEQKLFLTVYARIKIPNQPEELVDLITFQRSIKVAVNPGHWLEQNWKWIVENWTGIAAILVPFSVFIVAKWQWIKGLIQNLLKKKTPKS
jgi:glycerol-3-phosphate acyltransferase PlsY